MNQGEKQAGVALKLIVTGLEMYAAAFQKTLDCTLSEDHVIGQDWEDAAKAVIHMMNGPSGDADRTALAGILLTVSLKHGLKVSL